MPDQTPNPTPQEPANPPAQNQGNEQTPQNPPSANEPPANPPSANPPSDPPAGNEPPADGEKPKDGEGDPPKGSGFPDNWREEIAGDNDALLKQLQRMTSPKALADTLVSSRQKITELSANKAPGKDATPEQIKAYREEQGIPEQSAGYWDKVELPDGAVMDDDEKAAWQPLLDKLHAKNADPELVNEIAQEFIASEARQAEDRLAQDKLDTQASEDTLRAEWGGDYRANMNTVDNVLNKFVPADQQENIRNARLMDGTPLLSSVVGAKMFAEMGRMVAPAGTVVSANGQTDQSTIEEQLKTYEKQMGGKEWYNNDKAQKHYRELVDAYERNSGKKWTGSA